MDLHDAARYLGVSEDMLRRWVRQGLLPGASADGRHFERAVLKHWAEQRGVHPHLMRPRPPKPLANPLAQAILRGAVTQVAKLGTALDAITTAIDAVPDLSAEAREEVLEQTLARERMASTGLGHGIAMPHPRKPPAHLVGNPLVSVLYLDPPIDWASIDSLDVHTVFLLLSPTPASHVQILSRLAHAIRLPGFEEFVRSRPDRDLLVGRLVDMDEATA